MSRFNILSLFFLVGISSIHSQSITFPPDKIITASKISPLIVGHEVKGYYTMTYVEENKNKQDEYNLLIMDINFKITKDVILKINKHVFFKRQWFNGDQFWFTFANENSGVIEYYIYDMEGKLVKMIHHEDIKKTSIYPILFDYAYPVPYTGFFRVGLNPNQEKYMEMIGNNGSSLWKIYPKEIKINGKNKGQEVLDFFYADENYLILKVDIPKLDKEDLQYQSDHLLRAYDLQTGKPVFEVNKHNAEGFLNPMWIQASQNKITFFGLYFRNTDNSQGYDDNDNLGQFSLTYDSTGKLLYEHFNRWQEDVSRFIELNEKDQTEGNRGIWIEEIVGTSSGKTFAIGETYHKGFGGYSLVRDLIVFEFDEEFNLTGVKQFEKNKSTHQVTGNLGLNTYQLGLDLAYWHNFDYKFTSQSSDRSVFSSIYDNYDKSDKSDKKFVIGAVGFNRDQELVNPKITLTSKPDDISILPAKPGYVAIIEYFKKEKRASLTLYKFDF